ncbi:MAG: sugar ABC transporter permease [Nocardioidaceae bacterium]
MASDVASRPTRVSGSAGTRVRRSWRELLVGWAFVGPNLALLVLFLFAPLVMVVLLSFQKASSFGPTEWIGWENYRYLLSDPVFWRVLLNTVVFTVATVPTSIFIGLVLATILNRAMPARPALRTVIYLPIVISGLVTSMIGLLMFDEGVGVFNGMLAAVGAGPVHWQTNGTLAMVSVVLMTLWTRIGFAMVIYLAGLQDIPGEVYEAAELDGASELQQFARVTTPMLSSSTLFLLVMNIIWSFQIFDVIYVMTNGGPGYDTSMLVTYAYEEGFGSARDFGYGSTIGVVLFLLTLLVSVIQLRRRGEAAW